MSYKSETELLRYLSHPVWFQSLGCFLGFDWHSSGLSTVVLQALKESSERLGLKEILICGGKREGRKTKQEIQEKGEKLGLPENLVNNLQEKSRLVAKIDSALLQDEHQLYLHFFLFTPKGEWVVIQQGKNIEKKTARRYHWSSQSWKDSERYTGEVIAHKNTLALNWLAESSQGARKALLEIVKRPGLLLSLYTRQKSLFFKARTQKVDFAGHPILRERFSLERVQKSLLKIVETPVASFKDIVLVPGAGEKTWRALALACELITGERVAFEDPVRYSFAHGGKDGVPYKLNISLMIETATILEKVVKKAKIPFKEKRKRLRYVDRLLLQTQKSFIPNP